jgi:Secretion system C-terminal sorting domain
LNDTNYKNNPVKHFILTFIVAFVCANAFGQAPVIQWQKSLGGSATDYDFSIQKTVDGGYVTAGFSSSPDGQVTGNHGTYDVWVVKINDTGGIQWQKSLGGSGTDQAEWIQQTKDGGYIVAGTTNSIDGDITGKFGGNDCWVVKLDDTGGVQWKKCLGGTNEDDGLYIEQTFDGGYILSGLTGSNDGNVSGKHGAYDGWVIKIDDTGHKQWQRCLGGGSDDIVYMIHQTKDSGYIVAASSESNDGDVTGNHGMFDFWIVKLDDTGAITWEKSYGGSGVDFGLAISQTNDGGYIATGYSKSNDGDVTGNHGDQDYWVLKIDDTGAKQWQKSLGGTGQEVGESVQQTSDGGYIVSGFTSSNDGDITLNQGDFDFRIVKLSNAGTLQWQKTLGGSGTDKSYCIRELAEGGFIASGLSGSGDGDATGNHGTYDYWIVKLNCGVTAGTINGIKDSVCIGKSISLSDAVTGGVWSVSNSHATVSAGVVTGVTAGVDTVFYTVANTCATQRAYRLVYVYVCPNGVSNITSAEISITPNPTNGNIYVAGVPHAGIKVYNMLGQLVKETMDSDRISITEAPDGLYFVRVFDEDGALLKVEKVMKLQ